MKNWLYATGLGLALAVSATAQAADKIAVVNISSIFQQLPVRKAMVKKLENEFKDDVAKLQGMERDMQEKTKTLHREGAVMKSSERSKLEKDIMSERAEYSKKAQAFEQKSRQRSIEEHEKIMGHIQNAIKSVASKKGYDMVIDANAVAYLGSTVDITADVLEQVK